MLELQQVRNKDCHCILYSAPLVYQLVWVSRGSILSWDSSASLGQGVKESVGGEKATGVLAPLCPRFICSQVLGCCSASVTQFHYHNMEI